MDMLSPKEISALKWLQLHPRSWGSHKDRGADLNDPDMIRWLHLGFIEYSAALVPRLRGGYVLTPEGIAAIRRSLAP